MITILNIYQLDQSLKQAFEWVKSNLGLEGFDKFQEFKNERIEVIPMHLLKIEDKPTPSVTVNSEGASSWVDSHINTDKTLDVGKAQDTDNIAESRRKLDEK